MSTKTIALDITVYRKLLGLKRESESFSKLLDRLVEEVTSTGTGADVLRRLGHAPPALSAREAATMQRVVKAHRTVARHAAAVLTDNPRHFRRVAGLEVLELAR
jgi:predicted CopG family antitoxin